MPDLEEGVKSPPAPGGKDGVKDGDAPTPEALREANRVAEQFRKEKEELQEKVEQQKLELEKLDEKVRLSESERKRKALLEAGIADDEALVSELEALAAKGDATARAYLKKMEKIAEAIADRKVKEHLSKAELERDFDRRDEALEAEHAKWNEGARQEKMSLDQFKEKVGEFSDPGLAGTPTKQFKEAFRLFKRAQDILDREAKIKEAESKNGNFRDQGTAGEKGGEKTQPKSWRDAKTQAEKEAQLATL